MQQSIFTIIGTNPWKTTTIMCGVHGDEKSWIEVCISLTNSLTIDNWKIYIIFANLEAMERWVRLTEKNMNRCFKAIRNWDSYEEQRVEEIVPYLLESDYLLDIHNTINAVTQPFLISEHDHFSDKFDVPIVVSWLDDLHPWWSDGFMNGIGKVWLCLECGYKNDDWWVKFAKDCIINFLKATWNIDGEPQVFKHAKYIHTEFIYKADTFRFEFVKEYGDFDEVKKWEIIWKLDGENVTSENDCIILFPNNSKTNLDEQFVIAKFIDLIYNTNMTEWTF